MNTSDRGGSKEMSFGTLVLIWSLIIVGVGGLFVGGLVYLSHAVFQVAQQHPG
jgi:hypothetical protein